MPVLKRGRSYAGIVWRGPQRASLAVGILVLLVSLGFVHDGWHAPSTPDVSLGGPIGSQGTASERSIKSPGIPGNGWLGDVAPTRRVGPGMAYDSQSDRAILFGGVTPGGPGGCY